MNSAVYGTITVSNVATGSSTSALQEAGNTLLSDVKTNTKGSTGVYSSNNSTSTLLANGATFTGVGEEVVFYASVCITAKTDRSGVLYVDFSPDNTNWDSTLTFTVEASTNEVHRISISRRYFRCRFYNNSGADQTYLRLQSLFGNQQALTSIINSTIQTDADSLLTRSILTGKLSSGSYINVPVTEEGHLEVALHDPLLPFGSVHTEHLTPVFQTDAVYGINNFQVLSTSGGSGSASAADSLFTVATGTTIYSLGTIQSRKRLRYRPGQGVVTRFTAKFTSPVASSYQVVGLGHAEDGLYFGYKNTEFGILYNNRGVRECRTLTITTGATTSGNATVTLNGTAVSIAVTNASNIYKTAWELFSGVYTGWDTGISGATVIFLADSVGAKSGAFSVSGQNIVGSFAQTKAGAATTETFIAQSTWNGDKLDGTGASGITADWTRGNVFQLGIQYLGFGTLVCKVETSPSDSNNSTWSTVHSIKLPNTLSTTSFRNPSFPFTAAVYSAGSTTNLALSMGSFAGFIEGEKMLHGNRYSYYNQSTSVTNASYFCLLTVMNSRYFQSVSNQSVINLISISAALKHTSPCIIYLIKNGTLAGNPNFTVFSTSSCSVWDIASTTITWADNAQVLWSGHMGDTGEIDHQFNLGLEEFTLQPGEYLTICAKTTTGTAAYVTASLNTREDQ